MVVIFESGGLFLSRVFNSDSATITTAHHSKLLSCTSDFFLFLAVVITLRATFCNVRIYAWLSVLLLACCGGGRGHVRHLLSQLRWRYLVYLGQCSKVSRGHLK